MFEKLKFKLQEWFALRKAKQEEKKHIITKEDVVKEDKIFKQGDKELAHILEETNSYYVKKYMDSHQREKPLDDPKVSDVKLLNKSSKKSSRTKKASPTKKKSAPKKTTKKSASKTKKKPAKKAVSKKTKTKNTTKKKTTTKKTKKAPAKKKPAKSAKKTTKKTKPKRKKK